VRVIGCVHLLSKVHDRVLVLSIVALEVVWLRIVIVTHAECLIFLLYLRQVTTKDTRVIQVTSCLVDRCTVQKNSLRQREAIGSLNPTF